MKKSIIISSLKGITFPLIYHFLLIVNVFGQSSSQTSLCLPFLKTDSISSLGIDSVVCNATVVLDGGSNVIVRGFCWSTNPNPNMGNYRNEVGNGLGSYGATIHGLSPNTTYYVRAYAKNFSGVVYGNEIMFTTRNITVGSFYGGGYVFKIDSINNRMMICAPNDLGNAEWGCNGTSISGTSPQLGFGFLNTGTILSLCTQQNTAASLCENYSNLGFQDWFLPSDYELRELLQVFGPSQQANLSTSSYSWWWSSSQFNNNICCPPQNWNAIAVRYELDYNYVDYMTISKSDLLKVRPIRYQYFNDSVPDNILISSPIATEVTANSARIGGYINSQRINNSVIGGVVFGLHGNTIYSSTFVSLINQNGPFSTRLTNLQGNQNYFFRAFAISINDTIFGDSIGFTTTNSPYYLGMNIGGGSIFYIDSSGQNALISADSDLGSFAWGCENQLFSGTSNVIGSGEANTAIILTLCQDSNTAMKACDSLVLNGYSDWYLPSFDEMELLRSFKNLNGWYWTSSLCGIMTHSSGITLSGWNMCYERHVELLVRPIRSIYNNFNTPTVNTLPPKEVTNVSVSIGGTIFNSGGTQVTQRGVVYDTIPSPSLQNNVITSGSGIGVFNLMINGLSDTTLYHTRAFATNSIGTSYGNDVSFRTTNSPYFIGQSIFGGIIFYIDPTGQHGLICAPNDQGVNNWSTAINVCDDLVLNGYMDWRLPAINELVLMYNNLHLNNQGNFGTFRGYWSSNEFSGDRAFHMLFDLGYSHLAQFKHVHNNIRAVRSF